MLAAAEYLADNGGWEGVHMREVAIRAEVALGTLYRYFPSKEHLLVSVMLLEVEQLGDRLAVRHPEGDDAVERVMDVLRRANHGLQRRPMVTIAMIRAFVAGNTDVVPVVAEIRELMRRIISDALGAGRAGADDLSDGSAIDLLSDVWFAALVSWISGVHTAEDVNTRLEEATAVLFG